MSNELSKKDRGALIFQTVVNKFNEARDNLEDNYLKLSRAVYEMKRRLDVLEERVAAQSEVLFGDKPTVTMLCIACDYSFELSITEARSLNFTGICPLCHNWALAVDKSDIATITPNQIARETGRNPTFVCQVARENGLGHNYGKRTKMFTEDESQQLRGLLAEKRRRGNNGKHSEETG